MTSRRARLLPVLGIAALAAASMALVAPATSGAGVPVDPNIPDGDPGSLRDVLANASDGDVIELEPGATYLLTEPSGGNGLFFAAAVTINGNGATIRQTIDETIMNPSGPSLTLNDLTLTGGRDVQPRSAGAIHYDGSEFLTLNRVTIVDNLTCGGGGAIVLDGTGDFTMVDSTIANNGAAGPGGAIWQQYQTGPLRIINSTITNNVAGEVGGIYAEEGGDVELVYSDVVDNTTGGSVDLPCAGGASTNAEGDPIPVGVAQAGTANIAIAPGEELTSFGSVIALPNGGVNCSDTADAPLTNTVSLGYNFSDDDSCGLTDGTDRQSAGDPLLGALGDNGGPTPTRLPDRVSPLVNAIPIPSCGGGDELAGFPVTTDQRGVARPQETGCDIGSVEVEAPLPPPAPEPIVLNPTFTG